MGTTALLLLDSHLSGEAHSWPLPSQRLHMAPHVAAAVQRFADVAAILPPMWHKQQQQNYGKSTST